MCRPHFEVVVYPEVFTAILKIEAELSSEMSVTTHTTTRRHSQEDYKRNWELTYDGHNRFGYPYPSATGGASGWEQWPSAMMGGSTQMRVI